jgi:sensor histidine kinase YesM
MIIQPFVENAIEHGIKNKDAKGNITVMIQKDNGNINIAVEDDGIGRARARELQRGKNKQHLSMATAIIRERIRVLNRTLKRKVSLDIIDLKNDQGEATGTRVVLQVPLL